MKLLLLPSSSDEVPVPLMRVPRHSRRIRMLVIGASSLEDEASFALASKFVVVIGTALATADPNLRQL